MNPNCLPEKTNVWNSKVEFCCSECQTKYQIASFFSFLTNFKKIKDSKLCKVVSESFQNNKFDFEKFKTWIDLLGKEDATSIPQKSKKIKKRGRKKWTSRHDLILEGSILIWGDEVSKLRKLMPEFNENVIRKKLSHFLWKKYAINKDCLLISEVVTTSLASHTHKQLEQFSRIQTDSGTKNTSLQQTTTKEKSNESQKDKLNQWFKNESAFNFTPAKMQDQSRDCFDFNQTFKNRAYIESIADLSDVMDCNRKEPFIKEHNFQNSELYLYKNSALEIGNFD